MGWATHPNSPLWESLLEELRTTGFTGISPIGAGIYYDTNLFLNLSYERGNYLPRGISYEETWVPYVPVISPVDGSVIFNMTGNSPDAKITPGVNWVNGCSDPRFPDGSCPMGTPGLLTAIYGAWREYGSASRAATALFPKGPSSFEQTLYIKSGVAPNFQTPYTFQFNAGIQRELRKELVLSVDYLRHRGLHYPTQRDFNRLGAADTLRVDAARAAIGALHGSLGCPPGPEGVDCAIAAGATIQSYASYNLGGGFSGATPGNPTRYAFPGSNPKFNTITFQEGMEQQAIRCREPTWAVSAVPSRMPKI